MDDIIANDEQIEQILQQTTVIPEQAADGIIVIDLAGKIRFVNAAWAAIHGYNAVDGLIGKHISEFHTEEQMENFVADFIEEAKRRGQLSGPVERVRNNGTVFCSQTKMTLAKNKKGKNVGLVVFAADTNHNGQTQEHLNEKITELTDKNEQFKQQIDMLKQTESELEEQHDQLKQRLNQQNTELADAKEQLQNKINNQKQTEEYLRQQLGESTAANQQLMEQLTEREHTESELSNQLEQRLNQQNTGLADAKEQLRNEIAERQQIEQHLKQQSDELITTITMNEQLQSQIFEYHETEKSLKQKIDELSVANEQLKHRITEQALAEDELKIQNDLLERNIKQ